MVCRARLASPKLRFRTHYLIKIAVLTPTGSIYIKIRIKILNAAKCSLFCSSSINIICVLSNLRFLMQDLSPNDFLYSNLDRVLLAVRREHQFL